MKKIFSIFLCCVVMAATLFFAQGAAQAGDELALAKGPNGESATRASDIVLTPEDMEKSKAAGYTAALLWAGAGEWYNALSDGAEAVFKELGVEVVIQSDAQFNPEKQATDVETCLALKPDIILTLVVDPVSGARAFQPAVDAGVTLVLADNGVDGYSAGEQYTAVVTGDHFGMGRIAAELMNEALEGKGEIGFIFHDADFFVTNNRDQEFKRMIEQKYAGMQIVAEAGFTEEPKTEEVASAMLIQHPEIKGIYVAWDVAAEGVIASLRGAGREDVKIVTHDLGATNDLDMAMDGNMYGKAIDIPYDVGATMAKVAVLDLLKKDTAPFIVVSSMKVTKNNVVEAWQRALRKDPPKNVLKVLGEK
ncbi:MAG: substrate-binding domain-containing protein [bacterium]|nr:substrate-binding domain-containing protein [bacterium]